MKRVIFHLILFSQINSGKPTGIYYIDSNCLPVFHLRRSKRNKTFEEIAEYGRTSKITSGKQNDAKAGESIMGNCKD